MTQTTLLVKRERTTIFLDIPSTTTIADVKKRLSGILNKEKDASEIRLLSGTLDKSVALEDSVTAGDIGDGKDVWMVFKTGETEFEAPQFEQYEALTYEDEEADEDEGEETEDKKGKGKARV